MFKIISKSKYEAMLTQIEGLKSINDRLFSDKNKLINECISLKRRSDGVLFEVHGSHCSCYGFEGQLDLEETIPAALKYRAINGYLLGGFDEFEKDEKIIKDYILSL